MINIESVNEFKIGCCPDFINYSKLMEVQDIKATHVLYVCGNRSMCGDM